MLFLIYQQDRDDGEATRIRAATRDPHVAYLKKHSDIIVLGGALLGEDGIERVGSCLLVNLPDQAAAAAFAAQDPFTAAGLFESTTVVRMRRGVWNPSAAPQSAEGN
jgi:uncharacterized protein YciI